MKVFNLAKMVVHPYDEREQNVFYSAKEFKTRVIELLPGGEMPNCEMASYVIFYALRGEADVSVNSEQVTLRENQCLITEPAMLSIKTKNGVRLMGIQVAKT
jgi:mannose-6-phosphate isomerase-like protein (cupin superfamily)